MKSLRNVVLVFAVLAMLPMMAVAQKTEKIDCKNEACVLEILEKLKSPDQTTVSEAKAQVEIWANHVRYTGDPEMKDALKNAIFIVFEKYKYYDCDEYLFAELSRFCNKYDADDILRLASIEPIAGAAIRCVGDIPGSQDVITKYIDAHQDNLQHKDALAYAVGKLQITSMEDELISWLKGADDPTKIEIYNALLIVRSNEKTDAIIVKGAKKLNKSKNVDTKIAGMKLLAAVKGEKSLPVLYKSLKNKDKRVQVTALELMKPFANDEVCAKTVKLCVKNNATAEVLNWLGDIKNDSQMEFVLAQLASDDSRVVEAAIRAAFKIDNPDGIAAVKPMFGGQYQEVIKESMISYEGNYTMLMNDMLRGNDQQKLAALQILEQRPVVAANNRVKDLLYSKNQEISDKAYQVLKLVVIPSNADFLRELLQNCDAIYVEDVQLAIKNGIAGLSETSKDNFVIALKNVRPDIMPRYYKVFAYFGTELSVNKLIEAYESGEYKNEAKEALLLVDNKAYKDRIEEVLKH